MAVLLICACNNKHQANKFLNTKDSMVLLTVKPFEYNGGWGYNILAGDKVYIHQDQVPAISGRHIFLTSADAQKVGSLVVQKLAQGKNPPSLDSSEIVNAGIKYK